MTRRGSLMLLLVAMLLGSEASLAAVDPIVGFELYTDATLTTPGLVGSYVDQDLRAYSPQDDWRQTQVIAGTRVDAVDFAESADWGLRAEVGITGGPSDADWDFFSVQWDGYVRVTENGARLATISDDGSRMWIDRNQDGSFASDESEFVDNNWGGLQAPTRGPLGARLLAGTYRIRVQYAEDAFGTTARLTSVVPTVRVAYVIPSNRTPQPSAKSNLEDHAIPLLRGWYCEQMSRNGVGRLAPNFERDAAGDFVVHQIPVTETDDDLRTDLYGQTIAALANAGVAVQDGEVWMLIPETHRLNPDGTIDGVASLGTAWGDQTSSLGIAMTESALLELMNRAGLLDERTYGGLILPTVGALPLVQDVSFAPWGGATVGSNVSNILGALGHELTHGFGIGHDGRNEMAATTAVQGNLMGTGYSHFRGALYPEAFTTVHTRLSRANAQVLALSDYFQPCDGSGPITAKGTITASDSPTVSIATVGDTTPIAGKLVVQATASDVDGLAYARLLRDGDYFDEIELSGTSATFDLETTYFVPGQNETYFVVAYDVEGNRGYSQSVIRAMPPSANQAPRANLIANPAQAAPGVPIELVASPGTSDDSTPLSLLTFEWILDEGATPVSTGNVPMKSVTYNTPGTHFVSVRVTDGSGAVATSAPIAVRIAPACEDGLDNDGLPGTDFDGGASVLGATFLDPLGSDPDCGVNRFGTSEAAPGTTRIVTSNLDDGGSGTLRSQLAASNSSDRIEFAVSGSIVLMSQLVLDKPGLVIAGPGRDVLTISGGGNDRVFDVAPAAYGVEIADVAIENGNVYGSDNGGGIRNAGVLTLRRVRVATNLAEYGGGIYNSGSVQLFDVSIERNGAEQYGGGIYNASGSVAGVRTSFFRNDLLGGSSLGALIWNAGGTVELANIDAEEFSEFSFFGNPSGTVQIDRATLQGGCSMTNGGSMVISRSTILGSTCDGNSGIENSGNLRISESEILGFVALGGARIENTGSLLIERSLLHGFYGVNTTSGVVNSGQLRVVSSTIADMGGAGPAAVGLLNEPGGEARIYSSTITGAPQPGQSVIVNNGAHGSLQFRNVIAARTSTAAGTTCSGLTPIDLDGQSIAADVSCSLTAVDPLLAPIADNGGPTMTHALLPGSPAIDRAINCTYDDDFDDLTPEVPVAKDQRGLLRPGGASCDAGAFEEDAVPVPAVPTALLLLGGLGLIGAARRTLASDIARAHR